jgi:hypothetical protein
MKVGGHVTNTEINTTVEIGEISVAQRDAIKNGTFSISIFGEARYLDAFGEPRMTTSRHEVCFRGTRNAVELAGCSEGNSMT